jgi:hypothetical protein
MSWEHKSTLEEIRQRFDADVERFSNLETGQVATIDARQDPDITPYFHQSGAIMGKTVVSLEGKEGRYYSHGKLLRFPMVHRPLGCHQLSDMEF